MIRNIVILIIRSLVLLVSEIFLLLFFNCNQFNFWKKECNWLKKKEGEFDVYCFYSHPLKDTIWVSLIHMLSLANALFDCAHMMLWNRVSFSFFFFYEEDRHSINNYFFTYTDIIITVVILMHFLLCFFFLFRYSPLAGQYIDLDYSIWLWRALTPLIITFLLPMVFVLLIYLSSCFLYIYKLHR